MFRQAGSVDIRILSRLSTVCLLALGVSACSSDAVRFTETPFDNPFRTAQAPATMRDPATTGSIGSAPVQAVPSSPVVRSQALPPPQAVASAPIPAPAAPAPMAAPQPSGGGAAGWTAQGGTPVVIAQGETIDMISSRYGVPRAALLSANGLSNGNVAPGTRITIPVYNASASSAVAAAPATPAPRVASAEPRGFVRGAAPAQRPVAAAQAPSPREAKAAGEAEAKAKAAADAQAMRDSRARFAAEAKAKAEARKAAPMTHAATTKPLAEPKPAKVAAVPAEKPAKAVAVASAPAVEPKPAATPAPAAAPKAEAAPAADPKTTASLPKQDDAGSSGDKADFRWPVRGRVITGFAGKGGNEGLNIAVPDGTPVKAAEAGTVAYAGSELKGYGNLVLIRHPNGYVSAYAHNGELKVKRGDTVKRGQVVASSGQTGNVSSPQLHFELRKGSTPVDPTPYLNN
ncbi:LysM peptidoglycan-binding domain-containing M23 family metallopeptidase [Bosea sp. TND4EK4]|uniref:LysM peptidoglycan-binding domain-containing M23 family metallopeptidase n=1 Tax=Bosea sp. TND4EK4 TaxID=1907408 RepID=UPI000954B711|nr:LysM peptidoglycan-binding domain-containing M23 family metallopeptidase [Bosea sp. TND4EK4]SIQ72010.1 LysM domain-containing protein [Bosea sp. TND4EK4]